MASEAAWGSSEEPHEPSQVSCSSIALPGLATQHVMNAFHAFTIVASGWDV